MSSDTTTNNIPQQPQNASEMLRAFVDQFSRNSDRNTDRNSENVRNRRVHIREDADEEKNRESDDNSSEDSQEDDTVELQLSVLADLASAHKKLCSAFAQWLSEN